MPARSSCEIRHLLDEAPFVGSLARALAGQDADEVVQGTWLRAMESNVGTVRRPREWLARVVRGVAHNLRRGRARRRAHERAAARPDLVPSSAELMLRQERRGELARAVDALPATLRTVVLLRYFEDLPPRTIAEHLGLPITTVTSRLRTAVATLRQRLDSRHANRKAWLLPLVPAQAASALGTGMFAVTGKSKIVATVGVLALAMLTLWTLDRFPGASPPGPGGPGQPPPLAAELPKDQGPPQPELERTEVEQIEEAVTSTPPEEASTGTLVVKASYGEDGTPVPDLLVFAHRPGANPRFDKRRVRTDEHGTARIEDLAPGRWLVSNARNHQNSQWVDIETAAETEIRLELSTGILLTGIVVDRDGVAVAGAEVYLGYPFDMDAERVATTGADGRFALRSCPTTCSVGARAAGHAPSQMQFVQQRGGSKDLRIVLPAAGGIVEGLVLGPDDEPVVAAVVLVGIGLPNRTISGLAGTSPIPAQVRTGADGRFRAVGLAVGEHPVRVRAAGLAPWTGSCRVEAHSLTELRVTLGAGMSCTGVVVDAGDLPVSGVWIDAGNLEEFTHDRTRSAADGTFRFDGLLPGEVALRARHDSGKADATVRGGPGERVQCRLRLDTGLELRGRVLTAADAPVKDASVDVRADRDNAPFWQSIADTDADGRFTVRNCPPGRLLSVRARGQSIRDRRIDDVNPRSGEIVIRADPAPAPTARIVGTVVAPDAQPVPYAKLIGYGPEGYGPGAIAETSGSGTFELGPLVPGRWLVRIQAEGFPSVKTEWRQLASDAVWDLGTIQLSVGGTVRVRLLGTAALDPRLTLADSTFSRFAAVRGKSDERSSVPVLAGSYYVSVRGTGVASRLVPVEVLAGEETEVEVRIHAGQLQRFQFDAPAPLTEQRLRILRGDELIVQTTHRATTVRPISRSWKRWLAPGDYEIVTTGDGLSGRARFTVRKGSDQVVRVLLR